METELLDNAANASVAAFPKAATDAGVLIIVRSTL